MILTQASGAGGLSSNPYLATSLPNSAVGGTAFFCILVGRGGKRLLAPQVLSPLFFVTRFVNSLSASSFTFTFFPPLFPPLTNPLFFFPPNSPLLLHFPSHSSGPACLDFYSFLLEELASTFFPLPNLLPHSFIVQKHCPGHVSPLLGSLLWLPIAFI